VCTTLTAGTSDASALFPPAQTLHLQEAASRGSAATLAALWELANGMRLPYIMLTGLGWQDLLYNVPVQVCVAVQ
jgi:hypothetical protein